MIRRDRCEIFVRTLSTLTALLAASVIACAPSASKPGSADAAAELTAPPIGERSLQLEQMSLTLQDGTELTYERGLLSVPTQRDVADSQLIDIEFFRFFGPETGAGPPILRVMGGPGWTGAGERVERPGWAEFYVLPFTEVADLVIMGQRGFGNSGPIDRCPRMEPLSLAEALDPARRQARRTAALKSCRAQLVDAGVELAGYSVLEMSADVVETAEALGYQQFQLLGSSFGSHVGMAVLRLFPEQVVRATFNALEGPDHTYDQRAGQWAAMERIVRSAQRVSGATSDPLSDLRTLIERAREAPIAVTLELSGDDWSDVVPEGETRTVTVNLGPDDFTSLPFLRSTTFPFRWQRWFTTLEQVASEDLAGEAAELLWRWIHPRLDQPAALQLDCGSGISARRLRQLEAGPALSWLGGYPELQDCQDWGSPDLGEAFRAPFRTSVPALLLHGDHDTATPITNALEILDFFEDRHFVWVAGGSHGSFVEVRELDEFVPRLQAWLRSGVRDGLPRVVTVPSPFAE